jgi:hypothetical protein
VTAVYRNGRSGDMPGGLIKIKIQFPGAAYSGEIMSPERMKL